MTGCKSHWRGRLRPCSGRRGGSRQYQSASACVEDWAARHDGYRNARDFPRRTTPKMHSGQNARADQTRDERVSSADKHHFFTLNGQPRAFMMTEIGIAEDISKEG